jgi:hypothetical protein
MITSKTDRELITEFMRLLNKVEVSDSDREFRPNRISSCRVMDGKKLGEILVEFDRRIKNDNS